MNTRIASVCLLTIYLAVAAPTLLRSEILYLQLNPRVPSITGTGFSGTKIYVEQLIDARGSVQPAGENSTHWEGASSWDQVVGVDITQEWAGKADYLTLATPPGQTISTILTNGILQLLRIADFDVHVGNPPPGDNESLVFSGEINFLEIAQGRNLPYKAHLVLDLNLSCKGRSKSFNVDSSYKRRSSTDFDKSRYEKIGNDVTEKALSQVALDIESQDFLSMAEKSKGPDTTQGQSAATQGQPVSVGDQLEKLFELEKEGAISEEEYKRAKAMLLEGSPAK